MMHFPKQQLLVTLAALLVGTALHAAQVTDDRGVTVTLPAAPQRIVSILPSLTETVCELGHCARLVGAPNVVKANRWSPNTFSAAKK